MLPFVSVLPFKLLVQIAAFSLTCRPLHDGDEHEQRGGERRQGGRWLRQRPRGAAAVGVLQMGRSTPLARQRIAVQASHGGATTAPGVQQQRRSVRSGSLELGSNSNRSSGGDRDGGGQRQQHGVGHRRGGRPLALLHLHRDQISAGRRRQHGHQGEEGQPLNSGASTPERKRDESET